MTTLRKISDDAKARVGGRQATVTRRGALGREVREASKANYLST